MGNYNYSNYVFKFEKEWDKNKFDSYMDNHWSDCFLYTIIYVIVIFGGQMYMRNRQRYDLRPFLAIWSGFLAIYSIFGTIRTVPELIASVRDHGIDYSLCEPSYLKGATSLWCGLFVWSKVCELGDTLFIVLRKQQLIFLHWYHHITVMIYVWWSYTFSYGFGRWFMSMNYFVHSFMYTYYALRAMKVSIPKFVSMIITAMQLSQMVVGVTVCYLAWQIQHREGCEGTSSVLPYAVLMYFSYFILFANFFYNSYIAPKPKSVDTKKKHS